MATTSYFVGRLRDPNQLAKVIVGRLTGHENAVTEASNESLAGGTGRKPFNTGLSRRKRVQVIRLLLRGYGLRTAARLSQVPFGIVYELFVDVATAVDELQDWAFRKGELHCNRLQLVRSWSFSSSGADGSFTEQTDADGVWTWAAIDPETKLLASWRIGGGASDTAATFIDDLARRLTGPIQIRTENQCVYAEVGKCKSKIGIDRAPLTKIYGSPRQADAEDGHMRRASVGAAHLTKRVDGWYLHQATPRFSKKTADYALAISLHCLYYNYCRVDATQGITPARKAAIAGPRVWEIDDFIQVLENWEPTR
jgi:hypothetical protein